MCRAQILHGTTTGALTRMVAKALNSSQWFGMVQILIKFWLIYRMDLSGFSDLMNLIGMTKQIWLQKKQQHFGQNSRQQEESWYHLRWLCQDLIGWINSWVIARDAESMQSQFILMRIKLEELSTGLINMQNMVSQFGWQNLPSQIQLVPLHAQIIFEP